MTTGRRSSHPSAHRVSCVAITPLWTHDGVPQLRAGVAIECRDAHANGEMRWNLAMRRQGKCNYPSTLDTKTPAHEPCLPGDTLFRTSIIGPKLHVRGLPILQVLCLAQRLLPIWRHSSTSCVRWGRLRQSISLRGLLITQRIPLLSQCLVHVKGNCDVRIIMANLDARCLTAPTLFSQADRRRTCIPNYNPKALQE